MFQLGYNTNGLAHHRLDEALVELAALGYRGVAITPDVGGLDPYRLRPGEPRAIAERARELGLTLAVETGARFLLDPRRKHRPSLLEDSAAERERRLDFLRRSIDLAAELGAGLVSIWSGNAPLGERGDSPSGAPDELWERLAQGVARALEHARARGVRLGFEPEPGMFVERPAGYLELLRLLGERGKGLGLTLDVGHLLVTGDLPVDEAIGALAPHLTHVHLDDIRAGVHEHRMFGSGELDLPLTLKALRDAGYAGMAAVELSRDSHRGFEAAREAWGHLQAAMPCET
ncbi:MAG: sugar phosphate isomerase/epimerase [Planctomycetes bacterium]|nr:sugar phosphate isomerase/epimerase [Planctomycetota bacterium]